MPARSFRLVEGKSSKFWRVEVRGVSQTVTYGRIGTSGTSKTKEFPDAPSARAATEKLIAEKILKGYVEVGRAPAPKATATTARVAMDKAWAKAEKKLAALGLRDNLPKGASAKALREAEKHLGVTLPEDVRASYARHDGGGEDYLLEGREFLSLERMMGEWTVWKELHDAGTFTDSRSDPDKPKKVKADWWNPKWIPFTYDGAGNHHCIDLDPAPGGTSGQVITMWHDESTRRLVARSFAEFIAKARWGQEDS
jgi:cell wall assembly regulator SMI1